MIAVVVAALGASVYYFGWRAPGTQGPSSMGATDPLDPAIRALAARDERAPGIPMVDRLAIIAAKSELDPMPYDFTSQQRANLLLAQGPPQERMARREYELELAFVLLYAGQTQAAIQRLQTIEQGLESASNPDLATVKDIRMELAVAYLRLGEQTNCISRHTLDSCLLPIRGQGVHLDQTGSKLATEKYAQVLAENPGDLTARWMLNIAHMTLGTYPDGVPPRWLVPESAFASEYDIKRFVDVAPELGLDVVGHAGAAITDDFDGDGDLDIVFSSISNGDPLRYFRNDGDGSFSEQTEAAGLIGQLGGLYAVQTDYNNDGWLDLFVARGAWLEERGQIPDSLLRNNGDGTFTDVTEAAGLLSFHPNQVAAWGDYDNDGWLDLFVGNETVDRNKPPIHPNELYHNNGDGTFTDVAAEAGLGVLGYVKGATWGDYDNDGRLDLYVSLLGPPNVLYHNEGRGADGRWRFADVTARAGVTAPQLSFSTWFWDYDNDGWLDLFVADYGRPKMGRTAEIAADYLGLPTEGNHPFLYHNNRDGTFTDVSTTVNLGHPTLAMGSNFGDLDNDGWLDFYLGTGDPMFESLIPNRMFRNDGGRRFQDVTSSGGFGHIQKGHAVAFGDIDDDGDQDVLANIGGAYAGDAYQRVLFRNPGHGNRWITLVLEGVKSNRPAIGARIKVTVDTPAGSRDIHATVSNGSSFGGNSLRQEIGLGDATAIRSIAITWPATGTVHIVEGVAMDRVLHIREGEAPSAAAGGGDGRPAHGN